MNLAQLRQREDYDAILGPSVVACLSRHADTPVQLSAWTNSGAQQWWVQPLLGGYFVWPPSRDVRVYLRDSFRYTPRRARLAPQWLLGTQLATRLGLAATRRPGFAITPPLARAEHCLLIPGNQRTRVFDFAAQRATVAIKAGFDRESMRREIDIRHRTPQGRVPALLAFDPDGAWFQEPVIDAYALPRCPPWFRRRSLSMEALEWVEEWGRAEAHSVTASAYVSELVERVDELSVRIAEKFPMFVAARTSMQARQLARIAGMLEEVRLQRTHGDLQPGNILVGKRRREVWVIDWEHHGVRSEFYDRLCLGLSTRSPNGLHDRVAKLAAGTASHPALARFARSTPTRRRSHCALMLLEDLQWYLAESVSGPYRVLPAGLSQTTLELAHILKAW